MATNRQAMRAAGTGEADFRGERRSNDTHASTTDPEAKLEASKSLWANRRWIDSIGRGAVGARTWSISRRASSIS
jgi:hypothetical protein